MTRSLCRFLKKGFGSLGQLSCPLGRYSQTERDQWLMSKELAQNLGFLGPSSLLQDWGFQN